MTYPPDDNPLAPEDDPKGYADYLRRRVVAGVRAHLVQLGYSEIEDPRSYHPEKPVTLDEMVFDLKQLDEWKRDFKLGEID